MMNTSTYALFAATALAIITACSACFMWTDIVIHNRTETPNTVRVCTTVRDTRESPGGPPTKEDPDYWMMYEVKIKHQKQSVRIPVIYTTGHFCWDIELCFGSEVQTTAAVTCTQFCKFRRQRPTVVHRVTGSASVTPPPPPICICEAKPSGSEPFCSGMTVSDTLDQVQESPPVIESTLTTKVEVKQEDPDKGVVKCDLKLTTGKIIHKCWTKWVVPEEGTCEIEYALKGSSPFIESWGWGRCTYIRKEKETYDVHKIFHNPVIG